MADLIFDGNEGIASPFELSADLTNVASRELTAPELTLDCSPLQPPGCGPLSATTDAASAFPDLQHHTNDPLAIPVPSLFARQQADGDDGLISRTGEAGGTLPHPDITSPSGMSPGISRLMSGAALDEEVLSSSGSSVHVIRRPHRVQFSSDSSTSMSRAASPSPAEGSPTLGRGRFGHVFAVTAIDGRTVAQKVINTVNGALSQAAAAELAFSERAMNAADDDVLETGRTSVFDNVVEVVEATHDAVERKAVLTFELMDGGPLANDPRFTGPPCRETWPARLCALQQVAFDLVRGLDTVHTRLATIHRDLKPGNILTTKNGRAKIADFGCCALLATGQQNAVTQAGTTLYMAPERARGDPHGAASDVWSLGLCVLQLARGVDQGHPLVSDAVSSSNPDPFWALAEVTRFTGTDAECHAAIDEAVEARLSALRAAVIPAEPLLDSAKALDAFISACLQFQPAARPSASDLMSHPWFTTGL